MTLAFVLYKYFPFGGLQKDMLAIAYECAARGHHIAIYCRSWVGDLPQQANIEINILPSQALTNHGKNSIFTSELMKVIKRVEPDMVVGFNKIPGVQVYYAADTCFKAKLYQERPWFYRLLPRYQQFIHDESRLFAAGSRTHILALSRPAIEEYKKFYPVDENRFTLLPPGISRDRINNRAERLYLLHDELHLSRHQKIVLMIGSGFRTKGLDRAISALAALPENIKNNTHLIIAGEDNRDQFITQAKQMGVEQQVHFLGGRKDVPQLLCSADVLIHPAYRENTGTVLLEAAVACLPVITTEVCGYSYYISSNNLGVVLPSPFEQEKLNQALVTALVDVERNKQWRHNANIFAQKADIYDMPKIAVDVIETLAKR